jgi:Uri superfamily endonuclease
MRGTYILVMYLTKDSRIKIGKLGIREFLKGYYCYVGSAFGKIMNLENRIGRHKRLNKEKKGNLRWHIDYLLVKAKVSIKKVVTFNKKIECKVSKHLERNSDRTFKGFGSSDCKCKGHLHYFKNLKVLKKSIKGI